MPTFVGPRCPGALSAATAHRSRFTSGQTARPANRKGSTMTEDSVSFAVNLTRPRGPAHRGGSAGRCPGGRVGRRERKRRSHLVLWRDQVRACRAVARRAAGSWSWAGSSGAGRPRRQRTIGRGGRGRGAGKRACEGDGRRPGRRGARTITSSTAMDGAGRGRSMLLPSVSKATIAREDFLTNSRRPAGGLAARG